MTIERFTLAGTETAIFAEPANLNFFLNTPLTPDTAAGATVQQSNIRSHTRRQYPGDSSVINVSAAAREFLVDPGRRSGPALPGKSFRVVSDAGLPGEENRQFTYDGRWMDVHALFFGDAAMQLNLYSASGTRYSVDGTTP
jgi:hypothetical protein